MLTLDQTRLLYIIGGFIVLAAFWRRREAFAHAARGILISVICGAVAFVLFLQGGMSPTGAYIAALFVAVLVRRLQPARSRHIRERTKRQARARFERETGETFNRRIHEYDHILPHSLGGGNAEDNIQVLPRKTNRSKGAKAPWWDLLGR